MWALKKTLSNFYPIFSFSFSYRKLRSRGRKDVCLRLCSEFVAEPGWNQSFQLIVRCPSDHLLSLAGNSSQRPAAKSHATQVQRKGILKPWESKTLTVPRTHGNISGTEREPETRANILVGPRLLELIQIGPKLSASLQNQEQAKDREGMEKGSGMHILRYGFLRQGPYFCNLIFLNICWMNK